MSHEGDVSRSARTKKIWEDFARIKGFWVWMDDQGIIPWTDSAGHDVLAIWNSPEQAEAESVNDADADSAHERPKFYAIPDALMRMDSWQAAGVKEAGIQSEGGRFLLTIPLAELEARLLEMQKLLR